MSDLKLEFEALNNTGSNYKRWASACTTFLTTMDVEEWLTNDFPAPPSKAQKTSHAKALHVIKKHMSDKQLEAIEGLETVKEIWNKLKSSYDTTESIRLPHARKLWNDLRVNEYKSLAAFDIEMRKAITEMKSAGAGAEVTEPHKIEKILANLPPAYEPIADAIRINKDTINTYEKVLQKLQEKEAILSSRAAPPPDLSIPGSSKDKEENMSLDDKGKEKPAKDPGKNTDRGRGSRGRGGGRKQQQQRGGYRGQFNNNYRGNNYRGSNYRGNNYRGNYRGRYNQNQYNNYYNNNPRQAPNIQNDTFTIDDEMLHIEPTAIDLTNDDETDVKEINTGDDVEEVIYTPSTRDPTPIKDNQSVVYTMSETRKHPKTTITLPQQISAEKVQELVNFFINVNKPHSEEDEVDYEDDTELYVMENIKSILKNPNHTDTDIALIDSGARATYLSRKEYFDKRSYRKGSKTIRYFGNVTNDELVEGYGEATVIVDGLQIHIPTAYYSPEGNVNILSTDDLQYLNYGLYHDHIILDDKRINYIPNYKRPHCIKIKPPDPEEVMTVEENISPNILHQRMGHASATTIKKIKDINTVNVKEGEIDYCQACVESSHVRKPFTETGDTQVDIGERLDVDTIGQIRPMSQRGHQYILVTVDYRSRKGFIYPMKTKNEAYQHILTTIFLIKTHHSQCTLKFVRLDNAGEFKSIVFDNFCRANGITAQYSTPHTPQQNGIAEAYNKKLTRVARTILHHSNLPLSYWHDAYLHANDLISNWPHQALNHDSPNHVFNLNTSMNAIRVFGCQVWAPIPKSLQKGKMSNQRQEKIYVGYLGSSIVKLLDPTTGNYTTATLKECVVNETVFPKMEANIHPADTVVDIPDTATADHLANQLLLLRVIREQPNPYLMSQNTTPAPKSTPKTNKKRKNVSFNDTENDETTQHVESTPTTPTKRRNTKSTKDVDEDDDEYLPPMSHKATPMSHSSTPLSHTSTPMSHDSTPMSHSMTPKQSQRVVVIQDEEHENENEDVEEDTISYSTARQSISTKRQPVSISSSKTDNVGKNVKRNIPSMSKMSKKTMSTKDTMSQDDNDDEPIVIHSVPQRKQSPKDLMLLYSSQQKKQDNVRIIDTQQTSPPKTESMPNTYPTTIEECKTSNDWPRWKAAILDELKSLQKREVFTVHIELPKGAKMVDHRWVFTTKQDVHGNISKYKARLVAKGFSQRPGFEYESTYSPVVDIASYRLLLALSIHYNWKIATLDVVTAYLYGTLEHDIYMKVPPGIEIPSTIHNPVVRLNRALYGLKQSGREWYHTLARVLQSNKYHTHIQHPSIFFRILNTGPVVVSIYVDDCCVIGSQMSVNTTREMLKATFEMKDSGILHPEKPIQCIGIKIQLTRYGLFINQENTIKDLLISTHMINSKPSTIPLQIRNLSNDIYGPRLNTEPEYWNIKRYQSVLGSLTYLSVTSRPDIAFATNLLARYSHSPSKRHWNGLKQVLRYLKGTKELGLLYKYGTDQTRQRPIDLRVFVDAGFLSDIKTAKSQTGYVILLNGTAVSWRSTKQSTVATSSMHSELIALYESTRELTWIRSLLSNLSQILKTQPLSPTTIYEDNQPCIRHVQSGYIKSEATKHMAPKIFYTYELIKNQQITVHYTPSTSNIADILTKTLPANKHQQLRKMLGMCTLHELSQVNTLSSFA
ncbi:DNA-directed DNA polymerase [Synchytrium microbalum]|uniref:DNA-directed DNA polymerase n=1 Tax=Synchytrium microbalum TaxID=1806994 RepID=A0A507BQ80_9FUNG|nr:DNA-directed DNA polymerase [Synchytrium microbalum]TPX30042.1 DNA-directed DNA polymerase [Synchytrium microbalum]